MRDYVLTMARFFRLPPRRVLSLLTERELDCLAVEALLTRAVRL